MVHVILGVWWENYEKLVQRLERIGVYNNEDEKIPAGSYTNL